MATSPYRGECNGVSVELSSRHALVAWLHGAAKASGKPAFGCTKGRHDITVHPSETSVPESADQPEEPASSGGMSSEQVVRQLKRWFPGTYFSLSKEVTVFSGDHAEDDVSISYRLAVQPGPDGEDCQLFNGSTPAHCLDKYVTAVQTRDGRDKVNADSMAAAVAEWNDFVIESERTPMRESEAVARAKAWQDQSDEVASWSK